ncbi:histone-lysine N-methyltransferase 2D isoform E [Alligator mississippiensis]|uniref:Histone-lysine N-methyltransferase 2C n=1 Tax=Alligator mississippiensis TaxID=8496 RepID=A0A151PD73_ALLMI|nr:histone-lysine N-methyltransferase 2D isoform E [Alligator mississippiensis]
MDGLEAAETENTVETEVKEQSAEEDAQTEVDGNKQLTPVLQRSVSEESASSTASVGVEAKTSEQLCAFCYCGERSSLGQGDLKQFSPTPGFIIPWKNRPLNKSEANESTDGACERPPRQNSVPRKQRGQKRERSRQSIPSCTNVSTQTPSEDQVVKFWDELSLVGLPDDIDVQALFEPTGHCWAHHRCAEWSLGVCQTEEQLLVNVDKAVVSGSTERCAYCKHLGATIKCCEEICTLMYHYPCAAGAGTFQDFSNFSLLCPDHIDQAPERSKEEANCAVCDSPGDLLDQFFCTTCGQHYHGMCLDIQVTPLKRAGWQCPDCKVCQNCKHSGEDNKMLVCDTCDKGYHTFCLQPVMDSVPTNGWKCKNCRVCAECGTRTSCQWHHNCLVCDSCYQQQDNLPCPFCEKLCHPDFQKDMLHCHMCKRWIHIECDKPPGNELDSQLKDYMCPLCKQGEGDQTQPCDVMDTCELVPESGSMTACTNEMEIEGGAEDVAFQEQAITDDGPDQESTAACVTHVIDISQDEKTVELEKGVPDQVDIAEMETSPKRTPTPAPDDSQSEQMMEVTESAQAVTQQESDAQVEEKQLLQQDAEMSGISTEESQPPPSAPEAITTAPETLEPVNKEETAFKVVEQLETIRVQDDVEKGETCESSETPAVHLEVETAPANENCAKNSSPLAGKPIKSPAETCSSFSSSIATYVSVTPKIGMGKPAITKRKFSPGRPRSRQLQLCCSDLRTQEYDGEVGLPVYFKGAWSTNNTVSPPSWSPDISEGRDIFKSRQLPGSAIWSIKVGRGSGFPGKRRPRGAGLSGRGGRGRSKLKNGIGAVVIPGVTTMDISSNKEEEENSMHNTVVLFSNSDKFTLHQDMCVVCGSFGQGAEGRLLACSQCGQCYHPYCVSIKITKVVLSKGWRCLECTVCEACGKATDPGRLLLCDDCDISYHTYCLDPPLQTVPKGGWKCKWCVWCRRCGATSPGLRCEWQNNYTQCAPCASLSTCPICYRNYREEELIIQCRQCDRWIHAICQSLDTEEEVERIADMGFDCTICRPYMPATNVPSLDGCDSSVGVQMVSKSKELDPPKTYTQDGVCLTELGMSQLQSLTVTVPRRKRTKPKLKLKIINQNSVAVLQTPPDIQSEHSRDGEMDDSREGDLMDCDGKSDSSPERETVDDDAKVTEGADGIKKRKRKPYRPGIGGFMVRQRSRTGQGKTKRSLSRKDSSGSVSEQLPTRDEGWTEQLPDTPVDESTAVSENTEKTKKRYRKKKNKLEETFPAYLQEAFFGKDLLDTSRQSKLSLDNLSEESLPLPCKTNLATNFLDPSSDPLLSSASNPAQAKLGAQGTSEDPLADLSEVLNTDDDILGILSDDLVKSGDHSAGLDIGPISDDPSSLPQPSANQSSRPLSEEQLDGILSPELDKMVTDGAILGKLYKIPELGGKDVEDLFTAVLSPATTQPTPLPQPPPPPQLMPLHNQGESVFSRVPLMNGLIGPNPHLPHTPLAPAAGLGTFSPIAQPPYADARDKTSFNPMVNDPNSPWTPSAQPMEGEGDTMSNAQRSTLKWEKEEALGEMATVAPVLYTNINFPNLKEEFPDWATRVKQIAKLWRKASSQERAPYVQKARDNRAALRINKVQMSNDSMKRQQQQDSIDPSSRIDSDLFKDPLKQRESEHEQEWKFRQQMRQKTPTTGVTDTQNTLNMSQADTEKLRQRQKLREIILQQQQQKKNAVRQEKALQDPAAPPHAAPLQHWQQENINQIFNRPPPPYPGNIRASIAPPGGPRFTVFTKDHRGPFPADGQFNRPQFPGDMAVMGMRPHGLRFGFPGGGHGPPPGQERFLGSQQQMQRPGVPPQLRRSLSIDMPRPLNNPQMNNPAGLSQHFPPQGTPLPSSTSREAASNLQIPNQPTDGLEEKLDPDDPAVKDLDVKDLDGVEVKDLVDEDLENLNLDTEDGKGDELDTLDNLETNDPHLDDLLRSGEFDIIAYTDPELDLGDKKSMFNEELDLSVPIDDKLDIQGKTEEPKQKEQGDRPAVPADARSPQKKSTEGTQMAAAETELKDGEKGPAQPCKPELPEKTTATSQEKPVSSPDVVQGPAQLPAQSALPATPMNPVSGSAVNPGFIQGPSSLPGPQQIMLPQPLSQQPNRERPLLLEEQPLLLQDLLDQERQEQQQQRQMQAMIRQRSEPFFPNIDFDAITDPIMKAKMVALKGINKVMAQSNMGMPPMVMNRFPFVGQPMPGTQTSEGQNLIQQPITQDGNLTPQISRPNPPNFGPGFVNDSQRKQYEEWLQETQQLLQIQQKYLEDQIGAHRKSKKALSAKQRTAKKAGREFPEEDAEQLKQVTEQQSMVQKQLEQIRKQQKEHAELIEEYRIKQQQQCGMAPHAVMPGVQAQPPIVPGGTPPAMNQQNFPMVPHQQHTVVIPGQSNPARMPSLPSWQPGTAPPSHIPISASRMQPPMTQLPINPGTPTPVSGPSANAQSGPPPRVEFDDNNPFSESFQERERKERLREQQERQRIQLMQEVDRQRALQQRMEMEQHVSTPSELSRHQDEPESVEPTGPSTTNASESQSAELECMLPKSSLLQKQSSINPETDRGKTDAPASIQEIKLETAEADQCSGQAEPKAENQSGIKVEEDKSTPQPAASAQGSAQPSSTPPAKGESGNELLKHLLKNKKSGSLVNQKSESSCRPEEESAGDSKLVEKQNPAEATQTVGSQMQGGFGCGNSQVQRPEVGPETKKPRNKRTQRTGEKATPRSKKRKKEEEEKQAIYPNMDTFIQLKQQLSLLPLMEPIIGVSFAHFLPYGSGQINGGNRLVGSFGSATLDGVSDYYSQLIYKLVNGFATTEELAGKAGMLGGHDVTKALGPKQFQLPFRPQDDLLARAMAQGPKTVDVPASLPTPPHNNQEELRVQDHCDDRDTPDSFVPSSSPESVVGMEISRYPDLSLVKEETPEPVPSPIIPILPSSTGKGSEAKRNYIKSEPSSGTLPGSGFFGSQLGPSQNGPKSGLISVAITLHPTAAENISSVVAAFSNLLHVRIPNSYEVSSAPDIPSSMGVMNSHRANPSMEYRQHLLLHGPQAGPMGPARLVGSYGLKQPNMPFPPNSNGIAGYKDHSQNMAEGSVLRPQWCSHCKVVVLGSGVRKSFKDLPFLKQDPQESSDKLKDIVFCSNNCFVLYSAAAQAKKSESKELIPTLPQSPMKEMQPKAFHQYSNNISTLDVHCLPQFQEKASPPSSPPITFPPAFEAAKVEAKPDELKMQAFHSSKALFPIGYEASRLYWSMRYANRRCRYLCSIEEKDGLPLFVIKVIEQGHEDLVLSDTTPKGVWDKILEPVASVRKESEMLQLFPGYLKGEDLFGLTASAVARIAESLPGVEACENYTFRYGRNPLMELPLAINPTGCARAEPKMSTHVKRFVLRPHTLNSTSTSKSFQSTVTGELNAPYSKQFVHSKSSQYRKMKTEWKSNVYLARSRIQGLGLYAARDIEKHTMVIEYIGTIIRNEVANRKEKLYESQNRGVYMFRIDNDHVIDATLTGGPARYINHSCAPNCVAEVVTFERGHKIIISSSRRIQKGEELCYDYKFDFEDDQHKIPCHCGAVNCRKWMN